MIIIYNNNVNSHLHQPWVQYYVPTTWYYIEIIQQRVLRFSSIDDEKCLIIIINM